MCIDVEGWHTVIQNYVHLSHNSWNFVTSQLYIEIYKQSNGIPFGWILFGSGETWLQMPLGVTTLHIASYKLLSLAPEIMTSCGDFWGWQLSLCFFH